MVDRLLAAIFERVAQQADAGRSGLVHRIVLAATDVVADVVSYAWHRLLPRAFCRTNIRFSCYINHVRNRTLFDRLNRSLDDDCARTDSQCAEMAGHSRRCNPDTFHHRAAFQTARDDRNRPKGHWCCLATVAGRRDGVIAQCRVPRRPCRTALSHLAGAATAMERAADRSDCPDRPICAEHSHTKLWPHG